jgi:hypothetical protein
MVVEITSRENVAAGKWEWLCMGRTFRTTLPETSMSDCFFGNRNSGPPPQAVKTPAKQTPKV